MKKILLILSLMISQLSLSQVIPCSDANPFCSSQSYQFPNEVGTMAPSGPNYGCMTSQPNPVWYYMEIGTAGTIQITINQSTTAGGSPNIDVDFAMWGPFSDLTSGCASIMSGANPIQSSYSMSSTETIGIGMSGGSNSLCDLFYFGDGATTPPVAQVGQVYIVLLTNYGSDGNGTPGYLSFNQTGGTGSADCSIVDPCLINNLTATVSACDPATNQYSVTGNIGVQNPPDAGNLVITACDGTQVVVASAPFNASSYPYTINGLNSNGSACNVTATFTDGSCSQVLNYTAPTCPTPCNFTDINVSIGACEPGSLFDITGSVQFVNAPSTGQMIVQDCNGNQQTFNAPFTSPTNFALNNIVANGAACNITASFTASPSCNISINYTNTTPCDCGANIGTFTTTTDGNQLSNTHHVLCYGDGILIEANGDYTPAPEATAPPLAEGYEPGISWLVYSCPPTIGLIPNATTGIPDDPCILGIISSEDLFDLNDQSWMDNYPGLFSNNTVYFVPITMYNVTEGYYSYVNTSLPCYQTGSPIAITYLPEITQTTTQDCQAGTVSTTVQGGAPAVNGSHFTASNLTPSTASFATNNVGNNGVITISGLQDGDNYSFDIADANGCPITITGTFTGVTASDFTYPQAAYCKDEANPTPTITGATGGVFSGTAGLVINSSTGVINIASTPTGTYTVTYTSPGAPCNSSTTFIVTINPLPVVTATDVAVCDGQVATLTASGADTYSWSPATGLSATTGATVTAILSANQSYTITGTNAATGCIGTGNVNVTINPNPTPVITGDLEYCTGTTATIQTTQTYTSYSWSNGQATATAQVTQANNPITVTVTNAQGCSGTSPNYLVTEGSVVTTNSTVTICQGESAVIHGVTQTAPGVYSNTVVSGTGCDSVSNVTLVVNNLPVISAGINQVICVGSQVTLNATGAPSIVWNPVVTNNVPFTPTIGTTTYTATGTDANGCVGTGQVQVTVNPLPVLTQQPNLVYCNGTTTTTVNFVSDIAGTTYSWTNSNPTIGLASAGNGDILTFNATNTTNSDNVGTIVVTPTSPNGCVGATMTFTITIKPSPKATIASDAQVCIGGTAPIITFTANTGVAPYTVTYNINGATQTINITGANATVTAPTTASGVFNYNLVNVVEGGNGCTANVTGSAIVTVYDLPVINAGNDASICIGGSTTIVASGAGMGGTYAWNNNLGAGASKTVSPTVTTTYTVTGTDNHGCQNTDDVVVTINTPNGVDAGPNQTICKGASVVLNATSSDPASTYVWNNNIQNGVSFIPNQSSTYTVTATDGNGCISNDNVDVVVNSLPIIEAGTNISGCEGDAFVFTASGAGQGGTYVWSNGITNGVPYVPQAGNQIFYVTGTDANGCIGQDSLAAKIQSFPQISFVGVQDQNCAPVSATFTNTTVYPDNYSCVWYFDDGTTSTGCGTITHLFSSPGVYGATLQVTTDLAGCQSTLYQPNLIIADARPIAHFTPSPQIGTQINNQISFINGSYGAVSYYWEFGDGIGTSTEVNPTYTYSDEPNWYNVMLVATSQGGCVDTAYAYVTIQEELIFYVPNTFTPDKDQYNEVFKPIFTYGYDPYNYSLYIFNRWGEMVFESHDTEVGWDGTYGVNGKICQDGTYTWKIDVKTTANDERKTFVGHVNIIR
ncbi:MAG: PKD domain-containing protein [Crocinitomicaceae bacterium]|nr:PKD domain-containing protein [Crocinitomicaceae bacterium]